MFTSLRPCLSLSSRASLLSTRDYARRSFTTNSSGAVPVTVAAGDGIGPEILSSTLRVLKAAKANIAPEFITVGEAVYSKGITSGIDAEGWASIKRTNLLLKAPITTPLSKGVKSLNVTMRKTLGLFANVRPVFAYHPFVPSLHKHIDLVVLRENEEDLYSGIEHRHTAEVLQCLKIITVPGCENIIRYAFEYCRSHGRKRLTCVTKSNIMKITDGTFKSVFEEMAKAYPDIQTNHEIVDIATARIAARPQAYDVVVTLNLYGDIISDVAAEVAGSVGLAGSANIGKSAALFEAIHGSAPDIAGKDIANPCGLLNGAVMMLNYIGQHEQATLVHNAMLKAIEDGIHTKDIVGEKTKEIVGTTKFTDAVISRLGKQPTHLKPVHYTKNNDNASSAHGGGESKRKVVDRVSFVAPEAPVRPPPRKEFVGVDIFVDYDPPTSAGGRDPNVLAALLQKAMGPQFKLVMISNRGVAVWPDGNPLTYKVDHWRCRFFAVPPSNTSTHRPALALDVPALMSRLSVLSGLDVIKTENLFNFDGEPGFSLGQGQ